MSNIIPSWSRAGLSAINSLIRHYQRYGLWADSRSGGQSQHPRPIPQGVLFKNESGEEIPAYACMQITGAEVKQDQLFLKVEKPSSHFGDITKFLFNGPFAVEEDDVGTGQIGPQFQAFRDPDDDTEIEFGLHWMPVADEWYIERSDGGIFTCVDEVDADQDEESFRVVINYADLWYGKYSSQIASGATNGNFTLYNGASSTATVFNNVQNRWLATVPNDTAMRCAIARNPMSGKPEHLVEDCET